MNPKELYDLTHSIVNILIYGDIQEQSLEILGEECPSFADYNSEKLDEEAKIRIACAATVKALLEKRYAIINDPKK